MVRAARVAPLALAVLVVLAGCAAPVADGLTDDSTDRSNSDDTTTGSSDVDSDAVSDPTAVLDPAIEPPGPAPADDGTETVPTGPQPDPDSDVLGWESGYWYNDPVPAAAGESLNETQLAATIARAMARVEYVRGLEFETSVNVSVTSRDDFSTDELGRNDSSEALRTFDNAKFQAMYLVGPGENSLSVQDDSLNATVGGYYDPAQDAIVIVAEGGDPTLDSEKTLAHELVHALQQQHFVEGDDEIPRLRDAYNGRNGLWEGDANAVQYAYMERCAAGTWRCLGGDGGGVDDDVQAQATDIHMGVYFLEYFPYTTGPRLIAHLGAEDGWSGVDDAYDRVPTSAVEVLYPGRYGSFEPREIDLADDPRDGWERVRPPDRPDYGRLGQSALASTFAYTLYDEYNRTALVSPSEFLNLDGDGIDPTNLLNYDLQRTRGWVGDRLHAYERDGEVAAVWRLAWESPEAAERFAGSYRALVAHWGGERLAPGTWTVSTDSPFTGAAFVDVEGDTVTVVRAPDGDDLGAVYPGAR